MSNHEHKHGHKDDDHRGEHNWNKHGDKDKHDGHDWNKHGDKDKHGDHDWNKHDGNDWNKYAHNGDGCENPCHESPSEPEGCDLQAALAHLTDAISVVEAAIGQLDHMGGGTDFAHFDGSDQGHHYDSFA